MIFNYTINKSNFRKSGFFHFQNWGSFSDQPVQFNEFQTNQGYIYTGTLSQKAALSASTCLLFFAFLLLSFVVFMIDSGTLHMQ